MKKVYSCERCKKAGQKTKETLKEETTCYRCGEDLTTKAYLIDKPEPAKAYHKYALDDAVEILNKVIDGKCSIIAGVSVLERIVFTVRAIEEEEQKMILKKMKRNKKKKESKK